ncbi:putative AbiEii toxin of type IV toxin-antitoxin system [Lapillicoccus jejuensis]|uniref:Putative AbiEii toxin of type IV toxin-antitoxin system n=2 Tax=Lapillicoccus jejuensis TaxID=402171 RepID=A0A542E0E2_9MICO|nr:putative AbiEii toxin of type IV toxin-antitoxin system [Lapillicoccus jejuensis]
MPNASEEGLSTIELTLRFEEAERAALNELSRTVGWGEYDVPTQALIRLTRDPLAGVRRFAEPAYTVIQEFATQDALLASVPSLDVVYLPAERRLLPSNVAGVDLNQLSDRVSRQATYNARRTVEQYGRLDDAEFEQFAKALSVAAQLGSDPDEDEDAESLGGSVSWEQLEQTANNLIGPKRLLPLTRHHAESLRIRTPDGNFHGVQDLSSGERQALIIISRILRAGSKRSVVLIDEPDAYLHPHLSRRLAVALQESVGAAGQLIVATHSPSVLDALSPSSILRLSHDEAPRPISDEEERLDVYRSAGFRASALTQSDLLLVVEGQTDVGLLPLLLPELSRATLRPAGGRSSVFKDVKALSPLELPCAGVVDRDVLAPTVPTDVEPLIVIWPSADLEGVLLSSDECLQVMLDRGLIKTEYRSLAALKAVLQELLEDYEENTVAELAQRQLRDSNNDKWPTPRGQQPVERLRAAIGNLSAPTSQDLDAALAAARSAWTQAAPDLFTIVRGKYILGSFADRVSEVRSGPALLEAVALAQPSPDGLEGLKTLVGALLEPPAA